MTSTPTFPDGLAAPHLRTGIKEWLDRRWWRLIGYPAPAVLDPAADNGLPNPVVYHDTVVLLRRIMRFTMLAFCGCILVIIGAFLGIVPTWLGTYWTLAVPVLVFIFLPGAASGTLTMLISGHNQKRIDAWQEAGMPFNALWMTLRAPLDPTTYRAYWDALVPVPGLDSQGRPVHRPSVSAHLVWWLHAHHISPDEVAPYVTAGIGGNETPLVVTSGLSASGWATLLGPHANHTDKAKAQYVTAMATLWRWLRFTHAGLNPVTGERLDQATLVRTLATWRAVGLPPAQVTPCTLRTVKDHVPSPQDPCLGCGARSPRHQYQFHVHPFGRDGVTTDEWVAVAGAFAPFAIEANLGVEEVADMVRESPESVSIEAFQMLTAFNKPAN